MNLQDTSLPYGYIGIRSSFETVRIRFTWILAVITMLISLMGAAAMLIVSPQPVGIAVAAGIAVISLTILGLQRQKEYGMAANLLWMALVGIFITLPTSMEGAVVMGVLTVITLALLTGKRMFMIGNVLVLGRLVVEFFLDLTENTFTLTAYGANAIFLLLALLIVSLVTRYFIREAEYSTLRSARTASLLQGTVEVGQKASQILDQNTLLTSVVDAIRERFEYYHVQIFLVDENREYANLVASTGDIGRKLLNRGHRLAVGSRSVIGQVTQTGEPVIAADTGSSSVHARNELLSGTQAELALPIFDGSQIIGALDVQSTRRNAFDETDTQALQVLANQIGIAIRNARLFATQEESMRANQRLLASSATNLEEIRLLNRRLTQRAWGDYLSEKSQDFGVVVTAEDTAQTAEWTTTMREAIQTQQTVSHIESNPAVAVPIVLRGAVIGAIEIRADGRELEAAARLAEKVSQQLAISVENARLVEEAQAIAQREQHISDIAARFQSADTVEQLLKITLSELSTSLGASQSMIRLGRAPEEHRTEVQAHD